MPKRDPLLKLLVLWVTLLTVVLWLPLVRGLMNGDTYEWGIGPLAGAGTGGDYWKLLIALVYIALLQFTGRRGPRPLFPILLLPLLVAFDAAIIYAAWTDPGGLNLRGDTLGIDIPLGYILPIVFTLFVVLAVMWTIRRIRSGGFMHGDPPWVKRNWVLLAIAVLMVPVQVAAFRYMGEQGNQAGVIVTILQWFVLNAAITAPTVRPPPPDVPEAFPPP